MRKVLLIGLAVYLVIGLAVATILRDQQWYACPSRAPGGEMNYSSLDDVRPSIRDECRPTVSLNDRVAWFGLVTPLWPGLVGKVVLRLHNEVAMMECGRAAMGHGDDEYGVKFQWTPPGWTCETKSGSRYLGFWPRVHLATEPPRFEDARIVVRPGQERAYVGYTMIASGEGQYASYSDIRAVGSDGRTIHWKHQQAARRGSDDIIASTGRTVIEPVGERGGDAAFFDASAVKVGETVRVTFRFPAGTVKVPFLVVGAREGGIACPPDCEADSDLDHESGGPEKTTEMGRA